MAPINDADVKLMLAIIGSAEMIKTDNEKLAQIIGGETTANAIRQRVAKIKNQAKAVIDGTAVDITFGGSTTAKVKSTPKKTAAGGKNASADDDDGEGSATPAFTPKKRAANGKVKGTPRAKNASADDDDEGSAAPAPTPKKRAGNGKAKGTPRAKKAKEDEGGEESGEEGGQSSAKRVKSEESGEV